MKNVIIIRWGEIHLKGKNRGHFERLLENNIKHALNGYNCNLKKISGRYVVEDFEEYYLDDIIKSLSKVGGIHSVSPCVLIKTDYDEIVKTAIYFLSDKSGSFKVETKRADKTFFLNSVELSRKIGGEILRANPNLSVDVHNPDYTLNLDLRETGETLVFTKTIKMMGGMPSGSSGKGLLMISGGIDSPVAGYMMAKRGMKLDAIHFHSYPYTSEMAKEKVVSLAKSVADYSGGLRLYIVSFTEIQEAIHEHCKEEYMITLMRRFMMKISENIAKNNGLQAIITGESLGQVASQTIESITSSNSVVNMPVLRPLIAFDKLDIIEISEKIGTYETSILPYEDCCTVFLPKHPLIKPNLEKVKIEESKLEVDALINSALSSVEIIDL